MDGGVKWIVANWKSNKTLAEALDWVSQVGHKLGRDERVRVVVCPSFVCLEEVKKEISAGGFPMMIGSQDLSSFEDGPFTGEESAKLLRQFVSLSILGHSERRINLGETDQMIVKKVKQALENNIIPLLCVQDENTPIPEGVGLVAYEPPNAISTSHPGAKADTPEDAASVAKILKEKYKEIEVLYGGSVTSSNAPAFLKTDGISGVLVGAASLDAVEFLKIVEAAYTTL